MGGTIRILDGAIPSVAFRVDLFVLFALAIDRAILFFVFFFFVY